MIKRVLITGEHSYIGESFSAYLLKWPDQYLVKVISVRDDAWTLYSFEQFDVVFHVAGIAHVPSNNKNDDLYYKVNRDLAVSVAKKARESGVKQFIFMSSIIIYGGDKPIGDVLMLNEKSEPKPKDAYGKSKLEADVTIRSLQDDAFNAVVIRSPMVYGEGCKGNYAKLVKLARICPIFPDIDNKRSVISIDNLCSFIKDVIDNNVFGIFTPQDEKYMNTKVLMMQLREEMGKKLVLTKLFNPLIIFLSNYVHGFNKIFGSKVFTPSYCSVLKGNSKLKVSSHRLSL